MFLRYRWTASIVLLYTCNIILLTTSISLSNDRILNYLLLAFSLVLAFQTYIIMYFKRMTVF